MGKLAVVGGTPVRTAPWPAWPVFGEPEERALLETLRSGTWGRLDGQRVAEFERRFAAFQGARYGVASLNGTVTLRIALLAAGIGAGDEVIVPPYTFFATASAVVEANATPVFADIDPDTYNIDPRAIEAAVTPRTRAILPVHLAGLPADMDDILAVASRHGLTVIEDAAHAHGAAYKGRGAGSIGQMGSFSFQSSKNLTCGEGGIVLTSDQQLYERCFQIHNCGRPFRRGAWYLHETLGANLRMSEFHGAVLLAQLDRLADQTARRNANGAYLAARLAEVPGVRPQARPESATRHGYHMFVLRFDESAWGVPRDAIVDAVAAEGIPICAGYTIPLYRQPMFSDRRFGPYTGQGASPDYASFAARCPVCERVAAHEAAWMPQQSLLGTTKDMDDVVEALEKAYRGRDELRTHGNRNC